MARRERLAVHPVGEDRLRVEGARRGPRTSSSRRRTSGTRRSARAGRRPRARASSLTRRRARTPPRVQPSTQWWRMRVLRARQAHQIVQVAAARAPHQARRPRAPSRRAPAGPAARCSTAGSRRAASARAPATRARVAAAEERVLEALVEALHARRGSRSAGRLLSQAPSAPSAAAPSSRRRVSDRAARSSRFLPPVTISPSVRGWSSTRTTWPTVNARAPRARRSARSARRRSRRTARVSPRSCTGL